MGREVGMNDMWDAMCHEERKEKCSTPREVFSTKEKYVGGMEENKKRRKEKEREKKNNGKEREPAVL